MKKKISEIKVDDDRQRKLYTNIDELATSIRDRGQYQPILIDDQGNLIAGGRRLKACQLLGMDEVWVELREGIDDWTKAMIELEENICRENLTLQEEVLAKSKVHEMYMSKYGSSDPLVKGGQLSPTRPPNDPTVSWSINKTAEALGLARGTFSEDLIIAKAITANPDLIKVGSKSRILKQIRTDKDRGFRSLMADIMCEVAEDRGDDPIQFILGDSREVLKGYDDNLFDFCITDPPWNIAFDSNLRSTRSWMGNIFKDSEVGGELQDVFTEIYRTIKPNSHLYVVFGFGGMDKIAYAEMLIMLEEVGFDVRRRPLVWYKRGGNAIATDITTDYDPCYESIFYCSKAKPRPLNTTRLKDVFECLPPPSGEKAHPAAKPTELISWLIANCSLEGELGIDPFAGEGTFLRSCKAMNRRGIGIEKDKVWWFEGMKKLGKEVNDA